MKLRELMTERVITAARDDTALEVAQTMRDRGVGSVVVTDAEGEPAGIVTLDDIAVRTGNLEVAQRMTAEVIEGALPDFFFHERG